MRPDSYDPQLFPASWKVSPPPPTPRPREPASLFTLVGRAAEIFRARFVDVALIVAVTAGSAYIVQAASALLAGASISTAGTWPPARYLLVTVASGVISAILMVWLQTSLTLLAGAERLGAPLSLRDALRDGLEAVPAGIWTRAVQMLVLGVAFLALIVPAIILNVRFSVAMQLSAFERHSGLDALRASNELIRGRAWQTFARLAAFWILQIGAVMSVGIAMAIFVAGSGLAVRSFGLVTTLGVLAYIIGAGFAIGFYSIWRTEFYLALVAERQARIPIEMPDPDAIGATPESRLPA